MKVIQVWSLLNYLTEVEGTAWRPIDYTSNKIIKTVKGHEINGYFKVRIGNNEVKYDSANCEKFLPFLFSTIASKLKNMIEGNFTIIPIPNSSATVQDGSEFRTLSHANLLAKVIGKRAVAIPALRWMSVRVPSHDGGSRDPDVHFDNLRVVHLPRTPVILFDDVLTTGSQTIASYRRLDGAGIIPTCGVVVGRAVKTQRENLIDWRKEDLVVDNDAIDWDDIL
jgi:hypothetical protein